EQLLKKNQEATAQLAEAQAEIAKLRDQVLTNTNAMPAAEAIQLRAELTTLQAENSRLTTALAESDRQIRAAKVAGEKGDQLIQQLRKENDLLRQIAARQGTSPDQLAKPKPATGGFLWFKPKAKPAPAAPTNDVITSQSDAGKLTVSVKSPAASESAKAAAVEVKAAADAVADTKEGSTEVRLLVGQALTAMAAKDYAAAKPFLVTAVAKEPGNISVLMNLGITLYQLNEIDEALATLRQVVAAAPNQSAARSLMGIIHLRQGRIEDAYNELTRTVAIDPRNAEAHNYLGIVMNQKGWATAAEQEIRRALELNPNYADAHFNLAVLYSRQKTPRLELARYHYQKAVDLGTSRDPELEAVLKPADAPKK
ncbi:MAG: tetratricopeptide repeat protein, partial [Verrucomicrobiota bacterium]